MPKIGIIMGSDSDLGVMQEAGKVLQDFGVDFEYKICSAHRLPYETERYASTASERGLQAIIAGAGGAAHLPGVIAAYTIIPVIGVPIKTNTLSGIDSLYSIVQMPRGIPVATVAINGAANAALLALQIMALQEHALQQKLLDFRADMAHEVMLKNKKLNEIGAKDYLEK